MGEVTVPAEPGEYQRTDTTIVVEYDVSGHLSAFDAIELGTLSDLGLTVLMDLTDEHDYWLIDDDEGMCLEPDTPPVRFLDDRIESEMVPEELTVPNEPGTYDPHPGYTVSVTESASADDDTDEYPYTIEGFESKRVLGHEHDPQLFEDVDGDYWITSPSVDPPILVPGHTDLHEAIATSVE